MGLKFTGVGGKRICVVEPHTEFFGTALIVHCLLLRDRYILCVGWERAEGREDSSQT